MNRYPSLILLLPVLALPLAAQTATSPRGWLHTEAPSALGMWSWQTHRIQQVDATQIGHAGRITRVALRRNGAAAGGRSGARTFDLEFTLGKANFAHLTNRFADNYLKGTKAKVYTRKQTSLPNWTRFAGAPAPFDFAVPFDTPFPYDGQDALVLDFEYSSSTVTSRAYADSISDGATPRDGKSLGPGCTVSGQTGSLNHAMRILNSGPGLGSFGMTIRPELKNAPPSSVATMLFSARDPNLTLPGLCTRLRAELGIMLPFATSATGTVPQTSISAQHSPALIGSYLYSQFFVPDPARAGIPLALSNGMRTQVPPNPSAGPRGEYAQLSHLSQSTIDPTLWIGRSLVFQLTY